MNLLQRHIFASVLFTCAVAAGVFTFILIAGNALKDLLGYVLAGQLTPESSFMLVALLVPYVAVHALPIGILTGVLLVLGRMSAQQEITAMRAAGLGLGFVARPILVIAAAGVILSLGLNYYFMPEARSLYRKTMRDAVQQNPMNVIVPKTFIRAFPDAVIYVGEKTGGEMRDVWLWRLDKEKRVIEFLRAKSGTLAYDDDRNMLKVELSDVFADRRDPKNPEKFENTDQQPAMGSASFELSLEGLFGRKADSRKASLMTLDELMAERSRLAETNAPPAARMRVAVALNEKASGSFMVLAFTIMAIPLGIKVSRKETSANLGLAVLLALGYYFMTTMVTWVDRQPEWRPDLLVWVPPLLFITLGVWMYRRVERI